MVWLTQIRLNIICKLLSSICCTFHAHTYCVSDYYECVSCHNSCHILIWCFPDVHSILILSPLDSSFELKWTMPYCSEILYPICDNVKFVSFSFSESLAFFRVIRYNRIDNETNEGLNRRVNAGEPIDQSIFIHWLILCRDRKCCDDMISCNWKSMMQTVFFFLVQLKSNSIIFFNKHEKNLLFYIFTCSTNWILIGEYVWSMSTRRSHGRGGFNVLKWIYDCI